MTIQAIEMASAAIKAPTERLRIRDSFKRCVINMDSQSAKRDMKAKS